ncbi:MAG: rhomboid family intramembrane serine protease [Acidobacteriia bacterium]|nr:rhomboid family intramembrane serine protease [Terriglobia bacterium]
MALGTRSYAQRYLGGGGLPQGVKGLIIANSAIFLLMWVFERTTAVQLFSRYFSLYPVDVVTRFYVWQLGTYLFLHGGFLHILFNMLGLWFFGKDLEDIWGTRRFLQFYFFCGVGAGVFVVLANYLFSDPTVPTIGASGAIYGIFLVAAVLWPDRIIIFYIFPIKLKYFVMILGALAFFSVRDLNSGVSDIAHLSGMGFGYIFLKASRGRRFDPVTPIRDSYKAWKLARAKRKFQVYLKKQGSDRDRWVN